MSKLYIYQHDVVSREGLKHAMITGVADANKKYPGISSAKVLEISTDIIDGEISSWHLVLEVTSTQEASQGIDQ